MPLVKNKETSARLANYIGYKIFELRLIKGIKQTEMAAVLSLSRTQMNNIEAGRSGVSAEVMYNSCLLLDCTISELFPTEDILQRWVRPSDTIRKTGKIKQQIKLLQQKINKLNRLEAEKLTIKNK